MIVFRTSKLLTSIIASSLDLFSSLLTSLRFLAKNLREVSKLENKSKDEAIMDVNNLEVLKTIKENSLDILIHGHTHRPFVHDENGVPRMVLGDWDSHLWYIKSTDGEFELVKEKI